MAYQVPSMGMKSEAQELLSAANLRDRDQADRSEALAFLDDASSAQKTYREESSPSQANGDKSNAQETSAQSAGGKGKEPVEEAPKKGLLAVRPAPDASTAEGEGDTAATTDADDEAAIAALPFNQQKAGRALIEKRNKATQEAAELRARLAKYESNGADGVNVPGKAQEGVESPSGTSNGALSNAGDTSVDLTAALSAIPAPISKEERVTQEFVEGVEAEAGQIEQRKIAERNGKIAQLNQDIGAGLKTQQEAEGELKEFDDDNLREIQSNSVYVQNAKLRYADQQRTDAERITAIKSAIPTLLAKYPYANGDDVARWIGDGNDPEGAAKYSHERNAPLIESIKASVAPKEDPEQAKRIAELEKQVSDAQAELEKRKRRDRNAAAAMPTIGANGRGNGNAAPLGTSPSKPTSGFGFLSDARSVLGNRDRF